MNRFIAELDAKGGKLTPLVVDKKAPNPGEGLLQTLRDVVRAENNFRYVLEGNTIIALHIANCDELRKLRFETSVCESIQYLNLNNNKNLTSLLFEGALPKLQWLDVSRCGIVELAMPKGCAVLSQLWLQQGELETLSFSEACPELEMMDVSGNPLGLLEIPDGFKSLKQLYAVDCGLGEIRFGSDKNPAHADHYISPLPKLETLHLAENNLSRVPDNVLFGPSLTAVYLGGNYPNNFPGDMLGNHSRFGSSNSLEQLRLWFDEFRQNPKAVKKNYSVKLMMLGNGNVGKSTLVHSIKHGSCFQRQDSTHGVVIDEWVEKDRSGETTLRYQIWDFGGQEIYRRTHRLFLANSALQLIVFDEESEELARAQTQVKDRCCNDWVYNAPVEYWYETTREVSSHSRFIVAQNFKSGDARIDLRIREYTRDKDNLIPSEEVNAQTGEGVDWLLDTLRSEARWLPEFGMPMPASWVKVREVLIRNISQDNKEEAQKLMLISEFKALCADKGVLEQLTDLLREHLHNNGFLYYTKALGDQIIVDQCWALDAIYALLERGTDTYERLKRGRGDVWKDELFRAFDEQKDAVYTDQQKELLLEFMLSCGLCFKLNRDLETSSSQVDVYVFPEFLPEEEPEDITEFWKEKADTPVFIRQKQSWINPEKLYAFIVSFGRKTERESVWRYGIHVPIKSQRFSVMLDRKERYFYIRLESQNLTRWLKDILENYGVGEQDGEDWEISVGKQGNYQPIDIFNLEAMHSVLSKDEPTCNLTLDDEREGLKEQAQKPIRLKISVVYANTTPDTINYQKEFTLIHSLLNEYKLLEQWREVAIEGNRSKFEYSLFSAKSEIFHFIGHGDDFDNGLGLLLLPDEGGEVIEKLEPKSLKKDDKLVSSNYLPKVCIFNACYSHEHAKAVSRRNIHAIGYNDRLPSLAAVEFTRGFYRSYFDRSEIEVAFKSGILSAELIDKKFKENCCLYKNGKQLSRSYRSYEDIKRLNS